MSPDEIKLFCDRYMPSYEAYMGDVKFKHIDESKVLRFNLDPKRRPFVDAADVKNLESVEAPVESAKKGPRKKEEEEPLKDDDDGFMSYVIIGAAIVVFGGAMAYKMTRSSN